MYVVNEEGSGAINLDRCSFVGFGANPETGEAVLFAQDGPISYPLASGGDRPKRAIEAVFKAFNAGRRVVDLNDLLGAKPNLTIPTGGIIRPPNGGRP
jgi:hypothetical protein